MGMVLGSPAFPDFGWIPERYALGGTSSSSPPLVWWDTPSRTMSFAIVCDDLDSKDGRILRWALCDIPAGKREIAEDYPATPRTAYTRQGTNDFGVVGYTGRDPASDSGAPRHLRFRLFAVRSSTLGCAPGESARVMLARALADALEVAQLIGARPPSVATPVTAPSHAPTDEPLRAPRPKAHDRASPG